MVRFCIQRPIAVFMAFTAFFILGVITYLNIPVSLLPDIPIPEITIKISAGNYSARALENAVVTPVRQQLLQVGKLRDIRSETADGSAIVRLGFEYGADIDLSFIEVNEKVDAAMNYIPRDIDRPRVVKASATDIPVFNLYLTLKDDEPYGETNETDFLNLCEFSEMVIRRRIEQLPQVAMADITGLINKQIVITPDKTKLEITGISLPEIETALLNNNIEQSGMTVRDGYYEYSINFSSVMRTLEDISNVFIRKGERIYQMKDIADIEILPAKEKGMAIYNGKRAVSLSIIKQNNENMDNLQKELDAAIRNLENSYPSIEFNITQNQTELLDYTISNLKQNLMLAFIFVCLVSVLFLNDVKSPMIIGFTMFVSVIISLLFFYLFKISLNTVSLTGFVLALGMMIDNSIIVTDNVGQYRRKGLTLEDACVQGTSEVMAPMLSSVFTTIAIFIPLIFLSGIAGAIFFDQAFSVTVGLLVAYITGIILLPVLYKIVYAWTPPRWVMNLLQKFRKKSDGSSDEKTEKITFLEKIYHRGSDWIFQHKALTTVVMLAVFPLCAWLFTIIPKEKMPDISRNELIAKIEWNENIHAGENLKRTRDFLHAMEGKVQETSALVGEQQNMLNRDRAQSSSETEVYIRVRNKEEIPVVEEEVTRYLREAHPEAIVSFSPAGTIFEKIFVTGEAELVVEYYTRNRRNISDVEAIKALEEDLAETVNQPPVGMSFQKQLNLHIDMEKLLLYNVSYDDVHRALRTGFRENQVTILRSYQQYLPIILGDNNDHVYDIISNTLVSGSADASGKRAQIPLQAFVSVTTSEDIKTIVAGRNGEYIPFYFYNTGQTGQMMESIKADTKNRAAWDVDFSGSFFSNRKMIGELMVILLISIMLMYFILAAQFESFVQPLIVLLEIPIDVAAAIGLLILLGHSLNLMSAIGIVVTCGIIINDSILKVDVMNQLRRSGMKLRDAIHEAGRRRLNAIVMTSLTSIVCMAPLLFSSDLGSELEKPLAIATIGGMVIGTPVSLFVVPLVYWWIYRKEEKKR
ncbi:MAG: efflux RND transporter permease subunit [Bacteroidales bacterium]|jgi:multidrug efflux pump subunit AcrB|nr:efflux RND transporter permease subunit [Bacteroidales bacterium]